RVPSGTPDLGAGGRAPGAHTLGEPADRGQRVGPGLLVSAPPQLVVDDVDLVASSGESHRGRPTEVAVAAQDQDAHERPFGKVGFGGLRVMVPADPEGTPRLRR